MARFDIHTLHADAVTGSVVDEGHESFWLIQAGTGTLSRAGGPPTAVGTKDLLLFPVGQPHELRAGPDGLEFFDVAFDSMALSSGAKLLEAGVGPPHGGGRDPHLPAWAAEGRWKIEREDPRPDAISGAVMPPQEGDSCYRYPHARPHSMLDHWDQNSNVPGSRAADHSHAENEEFWFILAGHGTVEHGGTKGVHETTFAVGPGSLVGHPKTLHHTLVADKDEEIQWYCLCMNRFLSQELEERQEPAMVAGTTSRL